MGRGTVQVFCDNMAVVQCLRTGSAKDPCLNHLFRVLALLLARFEVSLRAEHVAGLRNVAADALLRNNATLFFSLFPQAPPPVSYGGSRLHLGRPARLGGLLDVQSLDGEARSLFVQGLSASSRSSYAAGKRRSLLFCARANLKRSRLLRRCSAASWPISPRKGSGLSPSPGTSQWSGTCRSRRGYRH